VAVFADMFLVLLVFCSFLFGWHDGEVVGLPRIRMCQNHARFVICFSI